MSNEGLNEFKDSSSSSTESAEPKDKKHGRLSKEELIKIFGDKDPLELILKSVTALYESHSDLSNEFEIFKKTVQTINANSLNNEISLNSELSKELAEFMRILSISKNPDSAPEHVWYGGNFRIHIQNLSL